MGLLDSLFGEAPSTSYQQRFGTSDVLSNANQLIQGSGGFLRDAGKNALASSAQFGPGIQGTIADVVARAQQGSLLQYLNQSQSILNQGTDTIVNPGSAGIFNEFLGNLSGGLGDALGAKLLGSGGGNINELFSREGGGFDAEKFSSFINSTGDVGRRLLGMLPGANQAFDLFDKFQTNRSRLNTFNAPRNTQNFGGGNGIGFGTGDPYDGLNNLTDDQRAGALF